MSEKCDVAEQKLEVIQACEIGAMIFLIILQRFSSLAGKLELYFICCYNQILRNQKDIEFIATNFNACWQIAIIF